MYSASGRSAAERGTAISSNLRAIPYPVTPTSPPENGRPRGTGRGTGARASAERSSPRMAARPDEAPSTRSSVALPKPTKE